MKNLSIILMLVFSVAIPAYAVDQGADEKSSIVVKKENKSVFKGLLYKVWARLRALNPQLRTNKTRDRTVVTMGIRGAETTSSIIEPYWKGDKTDDESYVVELTTYTNAQQFAEDGDLQKAVSALDEFIDDYSDSELVPNAQFALGISQGGLGKIDASKETLQEFVDDYPKHPLVADAKQVMAEL